MNNNKPFSIYVIVDDETGTPLIAFQNKSIALWLYEHMLDELNCELSIWHLVVMG